MGAGVVTVGRRPYAVGLYWENSPSGRVSQAAKEAARQPGQQAEFYAVRAGNKDGRVPQFGLGQAAAGHKSGMPAFAACIANQQPGSWAGAFRLREGTVVTIVRDDLIVPDGDQFFVNESEARDRLLQEVGFGGLQRIYAPESWAISGADTMPISLLMDERRDVRLKPVEIPKQFLIGGAILAFVIVGVLGITVYMQIEPAEIPTATPIPANPFECKPPEYPPPERVWEKRPPAMAVVASCHEGLKRIPAAIAGWRLGSIRCDGASISLSWGREKGFSRSPEKAAVTDTASSATLTISLPPLDPRGPQNLLDPSEITRRYLAQDWPGSIARAPDDPLPPPPPPAPGCQPPPPPPPPPWVKRSFTLTVPELPADLSVYFDNLPGAIMNNFSASPGGNWTIEGVIYENRI